MASMADESSLILPGQSVVDAQSLTRIPLGVVWLRNPKTGVIHKFHKGDEVNPRDNDTIARCLDERYTASTETAARAQAVELAKLQGRPLPPWADEERAEPARESGETAASHKATR